MVALNAAQQRAVEADDGPLAIVAGPGTGKTKTLVARIAWLIGSKRAQPNGILALTFTHKAAREIAERVADSCSMAAASLRIATFHGLCHELLQSYCDKPLRLIDESERLELIRSLKKQAELKTASLREISAGLSNAKSALDAVPEPALAALLDQYNERLQALSLCDFDDLLRQTYDLLCGDAAFRTRVQRFTHILVDEFQDTSDLQYELLRLINHTNNLFVIGDPAQAIYGFRGGSAAVFERFAADFPAAKAIVLETNYRSAPEIVRLANAVFPASPPLIADRTHTGMTRAVEALNEYGEAAFIINEIEQGFGGTDLLRSHQTDGTRARANHFRDYAVLYRTHRVATVLKSRFSECGIPYQIVGDGSPYDDPTIQLIMQVMRAAADPDNAATLPSPALKRLSKTQLTAVLRTLDRTRRPSELAGDIADGLALVGDNAAKRRSLLQFTSSLVRFDNMELADCMRRLDELADQDFYDERADAVTLSTIHASKGLEFDHVFLMAAEAGILPRIPRAATPTSERHAEEHRLFYVAVTRAKSQLDILHVRNRAHASAELSPFAATLSDEILPRVVDPSLPAQAKAASTRRQKRAQTSLF